MTVSTIEQLRALYGDTSPVAAAKEIQVLDEHCKALIGLSPFLVLATSNGKTIDASPKGDDPGFVQFDDEQALLIPDWPGNRRIDGLTNIIHHPWVGVLFDIPGLRETLRVNGSASIHIEPALLARFERKGRLPISVLRVQPEEIFMHCAKAFMRSKLWQTESWPEKSALPRMVDILKAHTNQTAYPDQATMEKRLRETLY